MDVQFDENGEGLSSPRHTVTRKEKGFIGFLLNHKYVKTRQQAQIMLLTIAVLAFAASIIIFLSTGIESSSTPPPLP